MTIMSKADIFDFTIEELIKDIWGQDGKVDGFFTTRELSEQWKVSRDMVREILYRARKAGYTISVAKVKKQSLDGRIISVPAYKISKKSDEE